MLNRGAENWSAATVASSVIESPMKTIIIVTTCMTPLSACRPGRRVARGLRPWRDNTGANTRKPKKKRKKTSSKG